MSIAIVIPARWASTRLPQKMLLNETGWPLIRHTYEQCTKAKLADQILIATDDERIYNEVKKFSTDVVMTCPNHPTGTDRLAEVASKYLAGIDVIINVQGDEPEIEPKKIDHLIELFQATDCAMSTLVTPFPKNDPNGPSPLDPNCVKAVLGKSIRRPDDTILGYEALYFSRSLIPYPRDTQGKVEDPSAYYHHLGIYAYTPAFLQTYVNLPQTPLELSEKLEQLRILEHGYRIYAGVVEKATQGIDTLADYQKFVHRWQAKNAVCITS